MIPLTNNSSTTTQKLVITLGGAATTTYPTCTVSSYVVPRQTKVDYSEYQSGNEFTLLTAATETTIAAAPPQGSVKDIHGICIYNADTVNCTATIAVDDNGTNRNLIKATLGTGESLFYDGKTGGAGWYSTDSTGAIKTAISQIPMAPLFLAYNSTSDTNQTGNGATATVDFDSEIFDVTSNFSGDTFTAPITGKYQFNATVRTSSIPAGATTYVLRIVTSNNSYTITQVYGAGTFTTRTDTIATMADMDAADTATVTITISGGAGDTATINGNAAPTLVTFFSGVRVG